MIVTKVMTSGCFAAHAVIPDCCPGPCYAVRALPVGGGRDGVAGFSGALHRAVIAEMPKSAAIKILTLT